VDGVGCESGLELRGRTEGRDSAVQHDGDPVAVLGFIHVVRRNENGDPPVCSAVDVIPELASSDGIEPTSRLVEEDDAILVYERHRKSEHQLSYERQADDAASY